jgi:hypothetical protein
MRCMAGLFLMFVRRLRNIARYQSSAGHPAPLMSRAARGNRQNIVLADHATISPLPAHSARDVTLALQLLSQSFTRDGERLDE